MRLCARGAGESGIDLRRRLRPRDVHVEEARALADSVTRKGEADVLKKDLDELAF